MVFGHRHLESKNDLNKIVYFISIFIYCGVWDYHYYHARESYLVYSPLRYVLMLVILIYDSIFVVRILSRRFKNRQNFFVWHVRKLRIVITQLYIHMKVGKRLWRSNLISLISSRSRNGRRCSVADFITEFHSTILVL